MKGNVIQKPSGRWQYRFSTFAAGQRTWVTKGGFATKTEALRAMREALRTVDQGGAVVKPSDKKLGVYLAEWLAQRDDLKPSTRDGYGNTLRAWIEPHPLARIPLRDLTPVDLTRHYAMLKAKGGREGRPLGTSSVRLVNAVIRSALNEAVEAGELARNPVLAIPRKQRAVHRPEKVGERVWTAEDAAAFLAGTVERRFHPLYALALDSGMRRGELAAVRWSDLDMEAGTVTVARNRVRVVNAAVEGDPKSGRVRRVSLDEETVAILRRWRTRQAEERLALGVGGMGDRMFTAPDLDDLHLQTISRTFTSDVRRLGLKAIRFHDLRHTSGSLALDAGVPPQVVQERLGHADIATTLRLYAHALPHAQGEAAKRIGAAIYGRQKVG